MPVGQHRVLTRTRCAVISPRLVRRNARRKKLHPKWFGPTFPPSRSLLMAKSKALWGGRFKSGAAQLLRDYTESVSFDWNLYRHDIAGSIAHAKKCWRNRRAQAARTGPTSSKAWRKSGTKSTPGIQVEHRTRRRPHEHRSRAYGSLPGGSQAAHGRSRNDQVATAMRLWIKDRSRRTSGR